MDLLKQFDLGYEGFLQSNAETLEALTKAMEAGSGVDAGAFTGGRALTPESLDTTLVNILHSTDEARLFQRLKKIPVKSVVHQWDERTEVGDDSAGWVPEGGASKETDQTIARKYTTAKYLQTLRKITLQAAQSNMIEDAMAIEQEAGALWIIRNVEKALFNGNSTFHTYQPDGLVAQVTTNVIDMRGADATSVAFENAMNESARRIRDYYGIPTDLFVSTMVMEDVQALLRDRIRFGGGMNQGTGIFNQYPTPFGKMELIDDVFLKESTVANASAYTSDSPGAVTYTSMVAGADASSEFVSGDEGDYWYGVAGVNRYGEGAITISGSPTAVTVAVGDIVTATITIAAPAPTCYALYRSKKDAADSSDLRLVGYFAYSTGTADTFADLNAELPGTSSGYVLNLNSAYNAIEWVQFLPMMRFPLYPTNEAVYPFLMLLFGSLAVKKEKHHVRIKNISPSGLGWY